jgi:hypothetical protein
MKTMITALALVALAASPSLAANAKHLREGRASFHVPPASDVIIENGNGFGYDSGYQGPNREQMIHSN